MEKFIKEYSSDEAIRKYTKGTAGFGISYLLENDYGKIYQGVVDNHIPMEMRRDGLNILEFGCGGGMNLIHLVSVLEKRGINVGCAYGTDFSERLIQAARKESVKYLTAEQQAKLIFCVARNENLVDDLAEGLNMEKSGLLSSFHLIIGVNTFRYCYRLKKESKCAADIKALLAKDGICIIIDMNSKFPFFRSRLRDWRTMEKEEYYLPSLNECARPFPEHGFEILRKDNFCWVPHSAGPGLSTMLRKATPLLNRFARSYAMRSLVICRKK